jgi:biotin carboxylase
VVLFDIPGVFIPKTVCYPSELDFSLQEKVFDLNKAIVKELGLPFGLTHSEFRVNERTGEVFFIETAARGGGSFISSDLMPLVCGLDPETILLRQVLGHASDDIRKLEERASGYYAIAGLPCGVLREIRGIRASNLIPGVHRVISNLKVGQAIEKTVDKTSRSAYFILAWEGAEGHRRRC